MDDEDLKSKLMEWTQEQIVEDFTQGLDSWHPEKK